MSATSLPVLMYHYISKWKNPISIHPALFEEHCKAMAEHGWHGVSLDEAEAYFINGKPLPKKSVLITFDDGFLDNYVYAYPILQKYGHHGVIFTVARKLEDAASPRKTLHDVWDGTITEAELPRVDSPYVDHALGFKERQDPFLNWEEARLLEQNGTMRIASHSTWHQTVFVSPKWEGFYQPQERTRTFDRIAFDVPWGLPRFEALPGLANRAFIPSESLLSLVRTTVPQTKAEAYAFFAKPQNVETLSQKISALTQDDLGSYENDNAYRGRLRVELETGKTLIEKELGRAERSLCWPWGAFNGDSLALGRDVGYSSFFTTEMGTNPAGKPEHIHRFKVKAKPAKWLLSRLQIYSRPWLAKLYAGIRI